MISFSHDAGLDTQDLHTYLLSGENPPMRVCCPSGYFMDF